MTYEECLDRWKDCTDPVKDDYNRDCKRARDVLDERTAAAVAIYYSACAGCMITGLTGPAVVICILVATVAFAAAGKLAEDDYDRAYDDAKHDRNRGMDACRQLMEALGCMIPEPTYH